MPSPAITLPFKLLLLFSLFLISPAITASLNHLKSNGDVLELDDSNLDAAISNFDFIFVDFYAPWCGHCSHLAPELEKAAPILAGLKQPIAVAKVDADKYKKLASKHGVNGYPTLKIFIHGVPTDYYGPRKSDLLVRFLTKFVAPDVAVLSSDSAIRDFIEAAGSDFPVFIGFGFNESMILDLAIKYKKKAWFSVAKDFSDEIMPLYKFEKVPALVAIHPAYNELNTFYGPFEEKLLEDYIKQSLLPLILPISQDSLKLVKDDPRKVVITIMEDETEEKSKRVLEALKTAASENRDLIFGYAGFKQWEEFVESFEVDKKTKLPKIVVWDGNEEYYMVIGSESIDDTDMGSHLSRFLEGYRGGNVIKKRITGPTLISFIKSEVGVIIVFVLISVVLVLVLVVFMTNDEPPSVGPGEHVVEGRSPTYQPERELHGSVKED